MKKLYITMTGLMIGVSSILAQPSPVQKVAKSVFTLTTFNKEGGIIAATQGVFIDNKDRHQHLQTIHRCREGYRGRCHRQIDGSRCHHGS